jgi:hypothetical protein
MIRLGFCEVIAIGLCVVGSSALASAHTGYWNQTTPKGSEFKCEGVYSKDQLVDVLRQAGWRVDEGIPRIDWGSDEAVVVAPSQSYKNGRMVVFSLERRGDAIVLDYGWKPLEASESVGANSASFGSVGEGKPTTIVVSYRRGLDSGLRFTCSNRGFVQ